MIQSNAPYRILSLDGGPSAPLQLRMLRKIEERFPGFLASTHQFAGTSDGALVALFIASRLPRDYEAAKRMSLDVLDDAIAFSDATIFSLQPTVSSFLSLLLGVGTWANFEQYRKVLDDAFGDMKLSDIQRDCHITSYCVDEIRISPAFKIGSFRNVDWTIVDTLMATTALPLYMPLHEIDGDRYIDGVMGANDSTFNAILATTYIAEFLTGEPKLEPGFQPPEYAAIVHDANKKTLEERCKTLRVLSLGVKEKNPSKHISETLLKRLLGDRAEYLDRGLNWGWLDWLVNRPALLLAMAYTSANDNMRWLCTELFADRYFRFDPEMEAIADVSLISLGNAQAMLDRANKSVDTLWKNGIAPKSPNDPLDDTTELIKFVQSQWFDEGTQTAPSPTR